MNHSIVEQQNSFLIYKLIPMIRIVIINQKYQTTLEENALLYALIEICLTLSYFAFSMNMQNKPKRKEQIINRIIVWPQFIRILKANPLLNIKYFSNLLMSEYIQEISC
ncbi:hypothetical protein ABPG72_011486 [Tetrahymena utriculariae]